MKYQIKKETLELNSKYKEHVTQVEFRKLQTKFNELEIEVTWIESKGNLINLKENNRKNNKRKLEKREKRR